MPTTDATLVLGLLATLDTLGVKFAVLHGEERLDNGAPTSDIDIIVERPGAEVLRLLSGRYEGPLVPVLVWESETCTVNTFWCLPDGSGGVQLDLLHDPVGRSMLAVRTDHLLSRRERGSHTWRLADADRLAYLASKRWLKGDREAVADLRPAVPAPGSLAYRALDPRGQRRIDQIRAGKTPPSAGFARGVIRSRLSRRGIRRLRRPCGYQIRVLNDDRSVTDQLDRVLIGVRHLHGTGIAATAKAALLVRKPLLVVRDAETAGRGPLLKDAAEVVDFMNAQLRRRGWLA